MQLTPDQLRAVERRDGPLLVTAGAGSGKTRVLVERFVRAATEDGVDVDRILAITFTEKAAGELRTRIRRRFLDDGDRDRARDAETAWISTIHGFCARILRAHPLDAGIDPEFRVLDEAAASRLAIDAFDRALEEFLADSAAGERVDLVASYTPDKLERMVRTVYARLRTRGERRPRLPDLDPPTLGDERQELEAALGAATRALTPAGGSGVDAARAKLERLADALARVPPGQLAEPEGFGELRIKRGNAKALRIPELEALEACLERWIGACASAKAYADYQLLARLVELHGRRYEQLKGARSALDFDDLELVTRDLLRGDRRLCEAIAGRFDHVMVDEYQDTNPLQDELLDLVARDNLFAVGDELQSIYGFRGADVSGFRERRARLSSIGRTERLATSFRMGPELVATVNTVFAPAFGDECAYDALESAPGAALDDPDAAPRVELLVADRHSARWTEALGDDAFGERAAPWRSAEARLVAARVAELVAGPYAAGDVALLVRAATDLDVYARALEERGVATYAAGAAGYWRRQEIADLRAYLAALANPRDELSLYNVLASPLVGVSLDGLAAVHRHARGARRDIWWTLEDAFAGGGEPGGLAAELAAPERERVRAFVRRFAGERRDAPRLSLEAVIDRAVTGTGYDRAVLSRSDGARRFANVRKLMRLAREFEAESGRDLRGLIDYVDEHELVAAREPEAPLEAEGLDAVRLMTIHAAKGLEFPVVVVADLGRDGRAGDDALHVSNDGRVGLEVASLTGRRDAALELEQIRADQQREADAEERRILYVAMTRARERLILSGATDFERWPEPKPLCPPIDWLYRALAPGLAPSATSGIDSVAPAVRTRWTALSPSNYDELLAGAEPRRQPEHVGATPVTPAFEQPTRPSAVPVGRLSYSALEAYKRCSYRFYLERVAGMRPTHPIPRSDAPAPVGQLPLADAPAATLAPLLRGTIVHELLERTDLTGCAPPDAAAVVSQARAHGAEPSPEEAQELAEMVARFVASPLAARIGRARRLRREVPFAFALDGLLVNGVIDVYAEEPDGVLIVDYKTDPGVDDPAAAADVRYSTQRLVYALAALRAGAPAVEVAYAFLASPAQPIVSRYEPADADRLEQSLWALTSDLLGGRFVPTDTPHRELCETCPGRPALCSWGPDRTLAEPADAAFPSAPRRTVESS
jgi:ATP-dependent helicase/nuclease subunit A